MHAVVFTRPDEYELADVPDPISGADLVTVALKSTTICATDVKILHGTVPFVTFPQIPGHEFGGEIVEVGSNVTGLQKGDLVGVEAHVGCGKCPRCLEGLYNLCENYGIRGSGHAHIGFTVAGGLAEYCAVPAKAAHLLPEGLTSNHAMFTDTLGIVLWAFERAGSVRGGETVAIVGPGALGLLAVQVARALGAGRVFVVGIPEDDKRLALASHLGADDVIIAESDISPARSVSELTKGRGVDRDETARLPKAREPGIDHVVNVMKEDLALLVNYLTNGEGADVVIELSGALPAISQSFQLARRQGRVGIIGQPPIDEIKIPYRDAMFHALTVSQHFLKKREKNCLI